MHCPALKASIQSGIRDTGQLPDNPLYPWVLATGGHL